MRLRDFDDLLGHRVLHGMTGITWYYVGITWCELSVVQTPKST